MRFIDAFSGPGGICLGLMRAGFSPALAFDLDWPSVRTHTKNIRGHGRCMQADARDVSLRRVRHETGLNVGELDLFAGGPPCQGFSKQKHGSHLVKDGRNLLVLEYARLVNELKPKFFLLENVAVFGQSRGRPYLKMLSETLGDYEFFPNFYNSADYGLAQTRKRFIVVGRRKDIRVKFRIPAPTAKKWRTVGEALDGLPEPPEDFTDHPDWFNHCRPRTSAINIKRFSFVPQGGGWQDIPERLRLPCHRKISPGDGGGWWSDVYGRLEWDGQCPTLTCGFASFTRGRYGHPIQNRSLTPREAARLQGFPDEFVFTGTRQEICAQIGNAVPPPLAEAVGIEIHRSLTTAAGGLMAAINLPPHMPLKEAV
jgi:DNA (cytosine-5)-methyltransferase 1